MKKWLLRTLFKKELSSILTEWEGQYWKHKEESSDGYDMYESGRAHTFKSCANRLAIAMGVVLAWHK